MCVVGKDGDVLGDFEFFTANLFGSEGLSLLVWWVGGVGASSVHIKLLSGVPAGILFCFLCVVGGDGDLRGDFECFATIFLGGSEILSLLV